MKIESWSIAQRSGMIHGQTTTDITITTHDQLVNNKSFIDYVQAYDPKCEDLNFDMEEYRQLKAEKAEREKIQDSFRGMSPDSIVEECTKIWDQLKTVLESKVNTPEYRYNSKRLSIGIEILRIYGYWWTPAGTSWASTKPTVIPDEMVKKEE